MDDSDVVDCLAASLERLKSSLTTDMASRLELAPIVFLRELLTTGRLSALRFDPAKEPQPASGSATEVPSMEIVEAPRARVYRVSRQTRDAIAKVAVEKQLSQRQIDWMIDNYFIHELIHYDQGMSGGNHSGLGVQAPQVLLAIDYQADALAVIVTTLLAWCDPADYGLDGVDENYTHWALYENAIESALHQIEIFTRLGGIDQERTTLSTRTASWERIQRIANWHYQLHRARSFNQARPLADFQILAQPVLDFRNLRTASLTKPDTLCRDWPTLEKALLDDWRKTKDEYRVGRLFGPEERPPLIVSGVSPFGTTRFVRHMAANEYHYTNAFEGFFDDDPRASRELFTSLFDLHPWLVGRGSGWGGGPGTPGGGPPMPPDLPIETGGLALDLGSDDRLDVLMQMVSPSQFPLTYMEAPIHA